MAFRTRGRFIVLMFMILLLSGFMPVAVVSQSSEEIPPPVFSEIRVNDNQVTRYVFENNTRIKILYTADRLKVDGVLLLGQGSNLTENLTLAKAWNYSMTLDSQFKGTKFFSIEINVTGFTKFYAWAWSGNITNGVAEKFDTFDKELDNNKGYHYLWIAEGPRYPEFISVTNATVVTGSTTDFVTELGTTVTINYRVYDPNNATHAVLAFSDNNTNVYSKNTSTLANMTFISFDSATNYSTYAFNYTLTQRVVFFTAFNSKGWERLGTDSSQGIVRKLSSYFVINSTLSQLDTRNFTDLDFISFNVTTYNQTSDDLVFVRYRLYENLTTTEASNWTELQLSNFTTPFEVNTTVSDVTVATTLVTIYNYTHNTTLKEDQKIEFQPFVKNKNFTEYLDSMIFEIVDSRPKAFLIMKNNTAINSTSYVLHFNSTTEKGTLSNVTVTFGIKGSNNFTTQIVTTRPSIDTKANVTLSLGGEGNYTIILNATNSLNRSRVVTGYFIVDRTNPDGSITIAATNQNQVTVALDYEDLGVVKSGLVQIHLDWGDGLIQDVANLTSVKHSYRFSGTYQLKLILKDRAGNIGIITQNITIVIQTTSQTTNQNGAISPIFIFSTVFMAIIVRKAYTKKSSQ